MRRWFTALILGLSCLATTAVAAASAQHSTPDLGVDAFARLPALDFLRLSPSGKLIAYAASHDGAWTVVIRTLSGETLMSADIGAQSRNHLQNLYWAGEDHVIVLLNSPRLAAINRTRIEAETTGAVSLNVKTKTRRDILVNISNYFGAAQVGGRWLGYFGLNSVDLDSGQPHVISTFVPHWTGWLVAPTGSVVGRTSYNNYDKTWKILPGLNDDHAIATGQAPFGGAQLLGLGSGSDQVVVNLPDSDGYRSVRQLSMKTGAMDEPLTQNRDVLFAINDTAANQTLGVVIDGDRPGAAFFDPALLQKYRGARAAFDSQWVQMTSASDNLDRMVFLTSGDKDPGSYWAVDMATLKAQPLGSPYSAIDPAVITAPQMIYYAAKDGRSLQGVLTLPPGRAPRGLPLVVLPHDGPEGRARLNFNWIAAALASKGYAVLQPNYRGSTGYGKAFEQAGFGEMGAKMQTDLSDGVATLAARGVVDGGRVCIVGVGYGGYAALMGVMRQKDVYQCAAAFAPQTDLAALMKLIHDVRGPDAPQERRWLAYTGASSWSDGKLQQMSPIRFAADADKPILLVHCRNDAVSPLENSVRMSDALRNEHKYVELNVLEDCTHALTEEPSRIQTLRAIVGFVERFNPSS